MEFWRGTGVHFLVSIGSHHMASCCWLKIIAEDVRHIETDIERKVLDYRRWSPLAGVV